MIINSTKYHVFEEKDEKDGFYKSNMMLLIKNFTLEDKTKYFCSASNSIGNSESQISVYGKFFILI